MPVREYRQADAQAWLNVVNPALGRSITPEQLRREDARAAGLNRRWVFEEAGRVLGVARLNEFPFVPAGFVQASVIVAPEERGEGVGGQLAAVLRDALPAATKGLSVSVRDNDPYSLAWAQARGFQQVVHRFASELDLQAFDPAAFQADLDRAAAQGVTFTTLADADAATLERYLNFHADRLMETPDLNGHARWPLRQVRQTLHLDDDPHPERIFLAVSPTGEWLGNTAVVTYGNMAYNELTAIHPQARGRGLALPLKVQAIQAMRQAGLKTMRTNNHSLNAPMLAVNRRLGFVQKTGAFELHLALN